MQVGLWQRATHESPPQHHAPPQLNLLFPPIQVTFIHMQINSCDVCQRQNYKLLKTSASLHPIPVKSEVWNMIGMDLIGPLQRTPKGNKYIMTVIDYYSKWAEAGPLQDKTAASVAEFLYSVS